MNIITIIPNTETACTIQTNGREVIAWQLAILIPRESTILGREGEIPGNSIISAESVTVYELRAACKILEPALRDTLSLSIP